MQGANPCPLQQASYTITTYKGDYTQFNMTKISKEKFWWTTQPNKIRMLITGLKKAKTQKKKKQLREELEWRLQWYLINYHRKNCMNKKCKYCQYWKKNKKVILDKLKNGGKAKNNKAKS